MTTTEYYYLDPENKPHGPHTLEALQQMLADGTLPPGTPVSYLGAKSWQPLSAVCSNLPEISPVPAGTPAAPGMAGKERYSDSMTLFEVFYFVVFKNYINFRGRATRREYWGFILMNFLCSFVAALIGAVTLPILANIYTILVALPCVAVLFRRLHDVGRSGWWYLWHLLACIPYFACMFYLVWKIAVTAQAIDKAEVTTEEFEALFESQMITLIGSNLPWLLLSLLPLLIVGIIILIFTLQDSRKGTNKYGPSYKYPD